MFTTTKFKTITLCKTCTPVSDTNNASNRFSDHYPVKSIIKLHLITKLYFLNTNIVEILTKWINKNAINLQVKDISNRTNSLILKNQSVQSGKRCSVLHQCQYTGSRQTIKPIMESLRM